MKPAKAGQPYFAAINHVIVGQVLHSPALNEGHVLVNPPYLELLPAIPARFQSLEVTSAPLNITTCLDDDTRYLVALHDGIAGVRVRPVIDAVVPTADADVFHVDQYVVLLDRRFRNLAESSAARFSHYNL